MFAFSVVLVDGVSVCPTCAPCTLLLCRHDVTLTDRSGYEKVAKQCLRNSNCTSKLCSTFYLCFTLLTSSLFLDCLVSLFGLLDPSFFLIFFSYPLHDPWCQTCLILLPKDHVLHSVCHCNGVHHYHYIYDLHVALTECREWPGRSHDHRAADLYCHWYLEWIK